MLIEGLLGGKAAMMACCSCVCDYDESQLQFGVAIWIPHGVCFVSDATRRHVVLGWLGVERKPSAEILGYRRGRANRNLRRLWEGMGWK